MAELLTGQVLFPGNDHIDQLTKILQVCGTPDRDFLDKITSDTVSRSLSISLCLVFLYVPFTVSPKEGKGAQHPPFDCVLIAELRSNVCADA